jgi:peptide/nickel transport system ATP-binding protein
MALLAVRNLRVAAGGLEAVSGVDMELEPRSRHGLVGESGSGKSLTALAIMGLLPEGFAATGSAVMGGDDLLELTERQLSRVRGERMAMVFQEPMSALNPVMRIGDQVAEVILLHREVSRASARASALALLQQLHVPDAADKMRAYPHQLSGGQRQRVMLAMALVLEPDLLIADEPTTALDVSVQAQILALVREVLERSGAALLLITHDLPVVSIMCERVMVMYGGRVVERGATEAVFTRARHPYTRGLLDAIPSITGARGQLTAIPGSVPPLGGLPDGCVFRNRCARATAQCEAMPPLTPANGTGTEHEFACWHPIDG